MILTLLTNLILLLLFVRVSALTELSVADRHILHTVLGKKVIAFTASAAGHIGVRVSFLGNNIFINLLISACKITEAKTRDSAIGTLPTQKPFQGYLLNSRDNI